MPRFRDVPLRDLREVASHVARLGSAAGGAEGEAGARGTGGATSLECAGGAEGCRAYGGILFRVRCAVCHGAEGHGDGPAAARLRRPPADFSRKQPGPERVRSVLLHGVPGTAMTAMQQNLSESDRDALVLFVRSLFDEGPQGGSAP
jgi:high-affinity iron transporter